MPSANPPALTALAAIASIVTRNHLPGHAMATAPTGSYVAGLLAGSQSRPRSSQNHSPLCAPESDPVVMRAPAVASNVDVKSTVIGREDVGSASGSGPASAVLAWYRRRVGGLGPGLTSESADAARAVLRDDLSAGPQVYGTRQRCRPDLPGLGRGQGSQLRRPAGACHPFTREKRWH